ncbi:MAG: hydroxymethylbilane synthase [Hyphomicrobiales bacterium]|nr:hydroxymethylbilane synthase [Hyphomicrobiales bacterium]
MQTKAVRIGTRGSDLALWQAGAVGDTLVANSDLAAQAIVTTVIRTSGDRIQDRALLEAGGKGLFTKEIEEALLSGAIDMAVHSAKDMPTQLPDGLVLAAYLPREDVRDAFIGHTAQSIDELPQDAVVGTASLRREALLKRARPDLRVKLIRGNVPTRLRRVADGDFDATLLAHAGLKRLGLAGHVSSLLDIDAYPPACGQGAVVIECREDDAAIRDLLANIDDRPTAMAVACERAFLDVLDGSCRTPIAGHARLAGDDLVFDGLLLAPDGATVFAERRSGPAGEAAAIGAAAGRAVRRQAGEEFLARLGIGNASASHTA